VQLECRVKVVSGLKISGSFMFWGVVSSLPAGSHGEKDNNFPQEYQMGVRTTIQLVDLL